MRVFIALELPGSVKDCLLAYQASFRELYPVGNYSLGDNFHVTLKFIGEVPADRLADIMSCMDRVALGASGFLVSLCGFGVFRKGSRGVVWSRVVGNSVLSSLVDECESCLKKSGFPGSDRPFRPHVTLGRNIFLNEAGIFDVGCDIISFSVDSFCLMESKRVDGVLRYVPVYRVFFGGMRD